jgi:hypothetical protein
MSGDTLTYDLSSMTEGTPQVFVKKDWLNILDNQSGNYQGNQSVVDTSQLANSNKYMNYREAYLAVPMLLTATSGAGATNAFFKNPQLALSSMDYSIGLRNWFGSIIHSFTLDYNGTTIIQQTPFVSMWNCFRLMTTLSISDIIINGADMGFYPDDPLSWGFSSAGNLSGKGTYNNGNFVAPTRVSGTHTGYKTGNDGFLQRQMYINFDPTPSTELPKSGGGEDSSTAGDAFATILTASNTSAQYKSYVLTKTASVFQIAIMATIHLKHIHNFFQNVPLLKGVFMKMTINLNQSQVSITSTNGGASWTTGGANAVSVSSALGGVSPIMLASAGSALGVVATADSLVQQAQGSSQCFAFDSGATSGSAIISIAVGRSAPSTQSSVAGVAQSGFNQSIMLYVPAYTFNPTYEDAYLSSPVKTIVYTDIYQYQFNTEALGSFNQLITNGIANIKSVLVIPYYTATENGGYLPYQSPFDDAGAGTTSPLCLLTNFNVVVAGQNMIYNTQKYSYEQFLNQLRGCGSVNADLTDGLTSGLINKLGFESKQCYYFVDCSRMLPVEEAVPKSVSIIGNNSCSKALTFFVFVEYGVQVSVDVLTGARV